MTPGTLLHCLFGSATAIWSVAVGRNWWPLGPLLVLLTAIPRSYDQTWIAEKPFLWIFGPLIFSWFSGLFLFSVLNGLFLCWRRSPDLPKPGFSAQLASFMGLFWLTAPLAWLYALPVERFLDSLAATKANLVLLGLVATWRVLLIARVLNVVNRVPFFTGLVWVLVPACLEVVGVFLVGGGVEKRILAGMGGMRNSPEEDLMLDVLGNIAGAAFWGAPVFAVLGLVLTSRLPRTLHPFPTPSPVRVPWPFLVVAAAAWIAVAIPAQRQVRRNATVEALLEANLPRAALDYLAAHSPADFAPGRPLPPKAFERDIFEQLPPLFGTVQTNDPVWVQEHLMHRLREMSVHLGPSRWEAKEWPNLSEDERREAYRRNLDSWLAPDAVGWELLLRGLTTIPEGQAWIATNRTLLSALADRAEEAPEPRQRPQQDGAHAATAREAWKQVARQLTELGLLAPRPTEAGATSP